MRAATHPSAMLDKFLSIYVIEPCHTDIIPFGINEPIAQSLIFPPHSFKHDLDGRVARVRSGQVPIIGGLKERSQGSGTCVECWSAWGTEENESKVLSVDEYPFAALWVWPWHMVLVLLRVQWKVIL